MSVRRPSTRHSRTPHPDFWRQRAPRGEVRQAPKERKGLAANIKASSYRSVAYLDNSVILSTLQNYIYIQQNETMLRGWNDAKAQPQRQGSGGDAEAEAITTMRREVDHVDHHRRQEDVAVEIMEEDPLASPGNSSLNSGHFGGWSIGPGMVDKESVEINPFFDEDDDEYESEEVTKTKRASSPRESHFTAHGLSMIKEDSRRGDITILNSPGNNNFDDVDLEATPLDTSATTTSNNRLQNMTTNFYNYWMDRNWMKGNIANRVLQEFQTNPKFKFQVLVALSAMLVAACLLAVIVAAPDGNRQSVKSEKDQAAHLSELLDGLQSSTLKPTSGPTMLRPTKVPSTAPTVKKTASPTVLRTEYPTLLPTMYPTFETLSPSVDNSTALESSAPNSLADTNVTLSTSTPSSMVDSTVQLETSKPSLTPQIPTVQPSRIQKITVPSTRDCTDSSGEFMTYNDKPRTCEWLDNGFNGAKSDRKDMNCEASDLGDACKYTCRLYNGCMDYFLQTEDFESDRDVSIGDPCSDKEGSFISNGDVPRTCMWLNEDPETAAAKKDLNCGTPDNARTELGTMCPGSCVGYNDCSSASEGKAQNLSDDEVEDDIAVDDEAEDDVIGMPTFFPSTGELNVARDYSGETISLDTLADSTISQKDDSENFGDSKRLNIEYDADGNTSKERQALLKFDLSSAAESFPSNGGKATLRIFSVTGSESGGIILKKMSSADWTEDGVKWKNVPGGDGSDEMILSSLEKLESNTWYDMDATAAVRDAIKNKETHLGLRIVSDESVDLYLGSKEREKEQPILILDPNAAGSPTEMPTPSPTVLLDCMDQVGKFQAHTGDKQECSWLNSGDEDQRKESNCQDDGEAAFFCQASCSMYNGCDDMHCTDMSGTYATHNGWTAQCSWLQTEDGMLALDQNCGGSTGYETTELGKRCQASCSEYNGCSEQALTKQLDGVPIDTAPVDTSFSPTYSTTALNTEANGVVPVDTAPVDTSSSPTYSTTSLDTMLDDIVSELLTNIPTFTPTSVELEEVADEEEAVAADGLTYIPTYEPTTASLDEGADGDDAVAVDGLTDIPTYEPTTASLDEGADEDDDLQDTAIPTFFPTTTGTTR